MGVRLLFRIPACSPEQHIQAFEQAAEHVRKVYGPKIIVDTHGSDVSRASFVSHDNGLWFYGNAEILPIRLSAITHSNCPSSSSLPSYCVQSVYAGQLAMTCWSWYGKAVAREIPCFDGVPKTNRNLMQLARSVATHAAKIGEPLTEAILNQAFSGWMQGVQSAKLQLRRQPDEYRVELETIIRHLKKTTWFSGTVDVWIRWTRHPDFPDTKDRQAKLLFAIRKHCTEIKSTEFFLGARDAATVTGGVFKTGANTLTKLVKSGHLKKLPPPKFFRDAQTYILL